MVSAPLHCQSLTNTNSKCLRVSKQWNTFLNNWPAFWRELDFSAARGSVSTKSVFAYIERAKRGVVEIRMCGIPLQGNKTLIRILDKCKKLERIVIITGGGLGVSIARATRFATNLKSFHTSPVVPLDGIALQAVLNDCANLSEVRCEHVLARTMQRSQWKKPAYDNLRLYDVQFTPHETASSVLLVSVFER